MLPGFGSLPPASDPLLKRGEASATPPSVEPLTVSDCTSLRGEVSEDRSSRRAFGVAYARIVVEGD
jgi:hypothetical protein